MNNVRELIQGDKVLTNNTEGLFLAGLNCSTKFTYPALQGAFKSLNHAWKFAVSFPNTHKHTIQHVLQHVAVHRGGPGHVGKGPLHVRGV